MSIFGRFAVLAMMVFLALPARAEDAPAPPAAAAPAAEAATPAAAPIVLPPAPANENAPPLPAPLQNLVVQGAQMRYLGRDMGLDGWIAIQNGQEQYFYVTPDQESFVMGLQFDKNGKAITLRQVQNLQKESGAPILDYLAGGVKPKTEDAGKSEVNRAFKTPAEQLYSDLEQGNWIPLGSKDAPYVYMIIDPECPYCKKFIKQLKENDIPNNKIQVRIVPVGLNENSMSQAAVLLAAPNAQEVFYRHLDGDATALPVTKDVNMQGVQKNLSIMQSWKLTATPTTVYRDKGGKIKLVQGIAKDIPALLKDIGTPVAP
jgi:protein-disulfide isomerase